MNKKLDIWQFAVRKLKKNTPSMLLVVAESSGSSPGRQGFKMIVAKDDLAGSIGGGVMEVRLVEQAKLKIKNEELKIGSEIFEQVHQKKSPNSSGMICSGKQTVIFFNLNSSHLKTVREIIRALESQQPKVLQITNYKLQIFSRKILISNLNTAAKTIFFMKKNSASNINFSSSAVGIALWLCQKLRRKWIFTSRFLTTARI